MRNKRKYRERDCRLIYILIGLISQWANVKINQSVIHENSKGGAII
jgi:hypothetical protein